MSRFSNLWVLLICLVFLHSCNTLYNTKILKIEVIVPGRAKIPSDYNKVALRYNNINVAPNPFFNCYFEDDKKLYERTNTDSIASEIYYQIFTSELKKQQFFDTIIELNPVDFSGIALSDSLISRQMYRNDGIQDVPDTGLNIEVYKFSEFIKQYSAADSNKNTILLIDPEYGLYTKWQIQNIANSTGADLFLSLDFFSSVDGIYLYDSRMAREKVYTLTCWNVYDLKKVNFERTLQKLDTIQWLEPVYSLKEAKRILPPRKDAVLNAADIAGSSFAEFLVPHWIEVDRMYYQSGHLELKKTDELIKQNRWLEAAEIWKKNTTNSNKSIAAKSMYNMALACEMNGEMDAAIDWAVKSYYVFGSKNQEHAFNCQEYIRILSQRKLDIRKIEDKASY
ncbi:MAG TPA: DUF6340 family protein [Draconibacterium sp.]|nr:DUF6340 family protein [Draconibacterium sp.]